MLSLIRLLFLITAPIPEVVEAPAIVVHTADGVVRLLDDRGRELRCCDLGHRQARYVRLAPNRQRLAYAVRPEPAKSLVRVYTRSWEDKEPQLIMECEHLAALFWMPDSQTLVGSGLDITKGNLPQNFRHQCWLSWRVGLATNKVETYDLNGEYRLAGLSPDGTRFFAVRTFNPRPVAPGVLSPRVETYWFDPTTRERAVAIPAEIDVTPVAPLPDGKRWLVRGVDPLDRQSRHGIYTVGREGWKALEGQDAAVVSQAVWVRQRRMIVGAIGRTLYMWDADGQNRRLLAEFDEVVRDLDAR